MAIEIIRVDSATAEWDNDLIVLVKNVVIKPTTNPIEIDAKLKYANLPTALNVIVTGCSGSVSS